MIDLKSNLRVFQNSKDKSDLELIKLLIEKGEEINIAKKIVIFTPIVFGRIHLNEKYNELEFSLSYHEKSSLNSFQLKEDRIYNEIYKFGLKNLNENILTMELYKQVLMRSPEIKAVIQILKQDRKVDKTKFRTMIIL